MAQQSVDLAKSDKENFEKYKWYLEIKSILIELKKRNEEPKRFEQENLENPNNDEEKERLDEIKKKEENQLMNLLNLYQTNILLKKSQLKKKNVRDLRNEDKKSFIEILSARYNPDNYPKNTVQEKLKYKIYHYICSELNCILSEL